MTITYFSFPFHQQFIYQDNSKLQSHHYSTPRKRNTSWVFYILLIWLTQRHRPFIFCSYGWFDTDTPTIYILSKWLTQTHQLFIFCPNGWHRHQPFETLVSWARREPGRSWSAPRTFSSPKNRRRWMLLLLQMMTLTRKRPPTKIFWPSDKDLKNKENIKTKVQSNLVWKVMSERWYFCTK